jgi:hypothetical protein
MPSGKPQIYLLRSKADKNLLLVALQRYSFLLTSHFPSNSSIYKRYPGRVNLYFLFIGSCRYEFGRYHHWRDRRYSSHSSQSRHWRPRLQRPQRRILTATACAWSEYYSPSCWCRDNSCAFQGIHACPVCPTTARSPHRQPQPVLRLPPSSRG